MKEDSKRWLMSRMKTSGSKRDHIVNGNYADERHLVKIGYMENLPLHEAIKSTYKFYNDKINYGLLVRFLRGNVGKDWNEVHHEIISRIPTKLLDYKDMVYWFVADKVEFIDGQPWDKKAQKFIQLSGDAFDADKKYIEFYVDPDTNKLAQIVHKKNKDFTISKR